MANVHKKKHVIVGSMNTANRANRHTKTVRGVRAVNPIIGRSTFPRNEPCPCGSGKKFKKCHGKNDTPKRVKKMTGKSLMVDEVQDES